MHNEKLFTLIKAPLVTEKSARVGETLKQIVFKVDLSANKREIKKAERKALLEKNKKKREAIAATKKKIAWCQEGQTEGCKEDKVKNLLKKLKDLGEKNVGSLED